MTCGATLLPRSTALSRSKRVSRSPVAFDSPFSLAHSSRRFSIFCRSSALRFVSDASFCLEPLASGLVGDRLPWPSPDLEEGLSLKRPLLPSLVPLVFSPVSLVFSPPDLEAGPSAPRPSVSLLSLSDLLGIEHLLKHNIERICSATAKSLLYRQGQ